MPFKTVLRSKSPSSETKNRAVSEGSSDVQYGSGVANRAQGSGSSPQPSIGSGISAPDLQHPAQQNPSLVQPIAPPQPLRYRLQAGAMQPVYENPPVQTPRAAQIAQLGEMPLFPPATEHSVFPSPPKASAPVFQPALGLASSYAPAATSKFGAQAAQHGPTPFAPPGAMPFVPPGGLFPPPPPSQYPGGQFLSLIHI